MTYRVTVQPRAERNLREAYHYYKRRASVSVARKWLRGIQDAIQTLAVYPHRCAIAPESDAFDEPIRQLLHGRQHGVYRILYTVDDAAQAVNVLQVRHGAREQLARTEDE